MVTIVPPPADAQEDGGHRPECGCLPPYADCPHPPCDCWVCVDDGPDALDSLPIAALLHSRLTSWFGDDRQSFLVADLVPVVTQIVAEFQHNAVEMARKAYLAERRAEEAEFHVEQLRDARDSAERRAEALATALAEVERLRDAYGVELDRRLAAERANAAVLEVVEAYESCGPKRQCTRDVLDAVTEALVGRLTDDDCDHQWIDRPESDTRECLICGTEVSG